MSAVNAVTALAAEAGAPSEATIRNLRSVAKGDTIAFGDDAALIRERLAYRSDTGRLLLTAEGRAILDGANVHAATTPLNLEIGDLRQQLRAMTARAEVAELRAAYWRAHAQYESYRSVSGVILSCEGSRNASKRADAALQALRAKGEEPLCPLTMTRSACSGRAFTRPTLAGSGQVDWIHVGTARFAVTVLSAVHTGRRGR